MWRRHGGKRTSLRARRPMGPGPHTFAALGVCVVPTRSARRSSELGCRTHVLRGAAVRVLGVDPGLTRCGVGVVEGVPGRPAGWCTTRWSRSDPDRPGAAAAQPRPALAELVAEHRPESVAVERVFSQHNVRTVMGTAQAGAVAMLAAARAGLPVQTVHPERGQGRRHRLRPGRQGPGDGDGDPAAAAGGRAPAGRRRRRVGPGHLPRVARRHAGEAASSAACSREESTMIASVRGRVAAVSPDGAVIEVGGVGLAVQCSPAHPGRAAGRRGGPAGHQPGRAGGLADPVRLRRRRRASSCSSCCRPPAGSGRGWPRRCWPCTPPTSCAGRSPAATRRR